jgi:hypothetical protein
MVRYYPGFENGVRQGLQAVLGSQLEKQVDISIVKNGNAVGGNRSICCRVNIVISDHPLVTQPRCVLWERGLEGKTRNVDADRLCV